MDLGISHNFTKSGLCDLFGLGERACNDGMKKVYEKK